MRIGAAQRELPRSNSERFLATGYGYPRAEWLSRYSTTVLPIEAHNWYKGGDGLWWLGKISASTTTDGYIWCFFGTTRGRSSFLLLRRATRLRLERYEGLDVCKYTYLARLHGGSNVTSMNLEAQTWIAHFRIAVTPDSFPLFWGVFH